MNGCFLAPDGNRTACADNSSQALTLLTPDGKTRNLGRRYNILGWIDATHLMVGIDSSTLAVLDVDSAAEIRVPLAQADKSRWRARYPEPSELPRGPRRRCSNQPRSLGLACGLL